MQRTQVDSDQIRSIGFEKGILEIEFPRGAVYQYEGPKVEDHYNTLMAAHGAGQSVGQAFNRHVRNCPVTKYKKLPAVESAPAEQG